MVGLRPLGVEVHFAAQEQGLEQAAKETTGGLIGGGGQVVDPDALPFSYGAGPLRQLFLADALFALKQHDALHGDGGAESQHEGLEVGQLLAPAAQGPGEGLGQVSGMHPGQVLRQGGHRRGLGRKPRITSSAQGASPITRGIWVSPGRKVMTSGWRNRGLGILAQAFGQVGQQGQALGIAPARPEPGEGGALDGLEVPGLLVIEPQVAADGIQGRGIDEPGQRHVPDLVQVAIRGPGCPDLGEEPGPIQLAAHEVPRAALALAELLQPDEAMGPEKPRYVHDEVLGGAQAMGGMAGSLPQAPPGRPWPRSCC